MDKKKSYTQEELNLCGHGEMFGLNNAQLPLKPMLMFDRIIEISNNGGKTGKGEIIFFLLSKLIIFSLKKFTTFLRQLKALFSLLSV